MTEEQYIHQPQFLSRVLIGQLFCQMSPQGLFTSADNEMMCTGRVLFPNRFKYSTPRKLEDRITGPMKQVKSVTEWNTLLLLLLINLFAITASTFISHCPPEQLSLLLTSLQLPHSLHSSSSTRLLAGWLAAGTREPRETTSTSLPSPSLQSFTCQTGSAH